MNRDVATKILRLPDVLETVGVSRTTLWQRSAPVKLGGSRTQAIGWRRTDVERWIEELNA